MLEWRVHRNVEFMEKNEQHEQKWGDRKSENGERKKKMERKKNKMSVPIYFFNKKLHPRLLLL